MNLSQRKIRNRRRQPRHQREHHGHLWRLKQLINREGGLCQSCREPVNLVHDDPKQATEDHIVPVSAGGSDELSNLSLLCAGCNSRKGGRASEARP